MKIQVIQKASPRASSQMSCPWMVDCAPPPDAKKS